MITRLFQTFIILLAWLACAPAHALTYGITDDTAGLLQTHVTLKEDNLYELSRQYDVGIVEMLSANPGVDVWQPEPGTKLIIPTAFILPPGIERRGIVINLSELRLYYFADKDTVTTYPIGVGREGWRTPVGITRVTASREAPDWRPPASIRAEDPDLPELVPAGPDNPMGAHAIYLGWPGYAIHGTNRPHGVGKRSSHGCIRMYPEDIRELFEYTVKGMKVTVIDQPYAIGWRGDKLYAAVFPTQDEADVISEEYRKPPAANVPDIHDVALKMAGEAEVDWHALESAISGRRGVPVVIARRQ